MRFNAGASSMSLAWNTARHCQPKRGFIASSLRRSSESDRFVPPSIPRSGSRLVHASSCPEPAEEAKLKVSIQERRAAASALATFLREKKGFKLSEVSGIRRGSPMFATKLAMLAKSSAPSGESMKSAPALLLHAEKLNVGEAVLESLGGSPEWAEEMAPRLQLDDERTQNILRIVQPLETLGLARKKIWLLFDSNESLWSSSPAEVKASISALHELVSSKELVRMIECCPLLLGRGSEEVLRGLLSSLREIHLDCKQIYNLLNLFQSSSKDSPKPVNLILQELGLVQGDARQLLISHPLGVLEAANSSLASAKRWFLKQGVDERFFWRIAIQNPAAGCRSPEVLQEQLGLMKRWGLSHSEALQMLVKHPQVMPSCNLLRLKLEYLVAVMEYPAQLLLGCPRYLRCSLEGNVKPRHQLVEWLVKQGKMKKPGNPSYLFMSEEAFLLAHGGLHEQALEVFRSKQAEILAATSSELEGLSQEKGSISIESSTAEARQEIQEHSSRFQTVLASDAKVAGESSESVLENSQELPAEAPGDFSPGTASIAVEAELEIQHRSSGIQAAELGEDPGELGASDAPEELLQEVSSAVLLNESQTSGFFSGHGVSKAAGVLEVADKSPEGASVVTESLQADTPPVVELSDELISSETAPAAASSPETSPEAQELQTLEREASQDPRSESTPCHDTSPKLQDSGESNAQPAEATTMETDAPSSGLESCGPEALDPAANATTANAPDEKKQENPVSADSKPIKTRKTGVLGFFRSIFNGF